MSHILMELFVAVVIRIKGAMTNLFRNNLCKDATQYNVIIEELTRDILIPTIFVNHFLLQALGTFFVPNIWHRFMQSQTLNFWNAAIKSCKQGGTLTLTPQQPRLGEEKGKKTRKKKRLWPT